MSFLFDNFQKFENYFNYDFKILVDLLLLSSKFEIDALQLRCEELIIVSEGNFQQVSEIVDEIKAPVIKAKLQEYFRRNFLSLISKKKISSSNCNSIADSNFFQECLHAKKINFEA